MLCWERDSEFFSDSDEEMENWKNQLHDISVLRCLRITREFCYISSEVRELPYFDDSGSIKECYEDPRNVSIPELEGERTVAEPPL